MYLIEQNEAFKSHDNFLLLSLLFHSSCKPMGWCHQQVENDVAPQFDGYMPGITENTPQTHLEVLI